MDVDLYSISANNNQVFNINRKIYDTLNICNNINDIILWNKYQLFLYESCDFSADPLIFEPAFKVIDIVFDRNYIACLDINGNIHSIPLKLKKSKTRLFILFKPLAQNVISILKVDNESILTLQNNCGIYSVCFHKSLDFQIATKTFYLKDIKQQVGIDKVLDKIVFKKHLVTNLNIDCLSTIFSQKCKSNILNGLLIISVLDNRTINAFIINSTSSDNNIPVTTLYYCPSNICDIVIYEKDYNISVLAALTSGTIIKLTFGTNLTPHIIHLNIPIYKFINNKDDLIYSDGCTLWKTENTFTNEICFKKFSIKNPKDFIMFGAVVICVTFSNKIYTLSSCDENKSELESEYQPVSNVIQSVELLFDEIKKNEELVKKIEIERNYTAAIALANRQDIVDKVMQRFVTIYDTYEEVINENSDVILTSNIAEYFTHKSVFILIKLTFSLDYKDDFKKIYNSLIGLLKLHVIIKNNNSILKTLSITIQNLDNLNFVVPLNLNTMEVIDLDVIIKLICPVGILVENQPIWNILFNKKNKLTSENFVKVFKVRDKIKHLKENKEELNDLILKTAENHHGLLLNFRSMSNNNLNFETIFYLKLPSDHESVLGNKNTYKTLCNKRAEYLSKNLGSNEFLKLNHVVQIQVNENKLKLSLLKENNDILLKLSGHNPHVAFHMRNYFLHVFYDEFNCINQYIPQAHYTKLEVTNIYFKLNNNF